MGNGMVFLLPFPKGYLSTPPARPAGGRAVTDLHCEGRRPGNLSKRYSLPPHNPTREGGPGGGTSSPGGSFPHFFPRNGAPAGQAKVPGRSNGVGKTHNTPNPLKMRLRPWPGRNEDALSALNCTKLSDRHRLERGVDDLSQSKSLAPDRE